MALLKTTFKSARPSSMVGSGNMKDLRWKAGVSFAFGLCLLACAEEGPSSSATADGGAESGTRGVDPFCRTRPRLSFCEDFDEATLPGRFVRIDGSPEIVTIEAHPDAPSAPNAIRIAQSATANDARLVLQAAQGVKYNFFFFVRLEPGHGRVELAGFDDGEYHLEIGVGEDNHWYVEERPGATDGGAPMPRTLTTNVEPKLSAFSSVRLDVYVDDAGLGHMRFRSGDDVVFQSEPLTFGHGKATLTPTIYVGARLREGAPSTLWIDSVSLGED